MAGGGNFVHRVMSYLVNELLVNSLANNPSFQRFAVRTSRKIEDISKTALQKRQELTEQMKDIADVSFIFFAWTEPDRGLNLTKYEIIPTLVSF